MDKQKTDDPKTKNISEESENNFLFSIQSTKQIQLQFLLFWNHSLNFNFSEISLYKYLYINIEDMKIKRKSFLSETARKE